jgi:hypothetical protein
LGRPVFPLIVRVLLIAAGVSSAGCSSLETLTPESLESARRQWQSTRPSLYRLVLDMSGDRVESGRFEVTVQGDAVSALRRNGQVILPGRGQDYSMDGFFRMLDQELELAKKPVLLGAPPGYTAYLMVQFDPGTGRLLHYRRTVGGTENSIEIEITEFEALPQ